MSPRDKAVPVDPLVETSVRCACCGEVGATPDAEHGSDLCDVCVRVLAAEVWEDDDVDDAVNRRACL